MGKLRLREVICSQPAWPTGRLTLVAVSASPGDKGRLLGHSWVPVPWAPTPVPRKRPREELGFLEMAQTQSEETVSGCVLPVTPLDLCFQVCEMRVCTVISVGSFCLIHL